MTVPLVHNPDMAPIDLKNLGEELLEEFRQFKPEWSARVDESKVSKVVLWANGFTLKLDVVADIVDSTGRYDTLRMQVFRDPRDPLAEHSDTNEKVFERAWRFPSKRELALWRDVETGTDMDTPQVSAAMRRHFCETMSASAR